jgi:G3E family GTPase
VGKLSVSGISEISSSTLKLEKNKVQDLDGDKAKKALLRSKGFVWMATSGSAAYFMSHAGQFLDLIVMGRY